MGKWISIIVIVFLLLSCNNSTKDFELDRLKADSLFHISSNYITRIPNELKDDAKALDLLNKALRIDPNNISYLQNRGACKINLLLFEKAILDFDKILSIDNRNVLSLINKTICLNHLGRYEEGKQFIDFAISINQNFGYAYFVRSDYYLNKNDVENLCIDVKKAFDNNYSPALSRINKYCKTNFKQLKF